MLDIKRVTAGKGGEALLIEGSEKAALYDTGMAYCAFDLVENIKRELKGGKLDYVLLSHTHYDHLGGIPYLRKEWPKLQVFGSAYGKSVLERPGALAAIRSMALIAAEEYTGIKELNPDYSDDSLKIDIAVGNGGRISLGDRTVSVHETRGHTNCSLSFFIEEDRILFASESTGVYVAHRVVKPVPLTGSKDMLESIELCRKLGAKYIYSPHYLLVEDEAAKDYWDISRAAIEEFMDTTEELYKKNYSVEEIIEAHKKRWWEPYCMEEQPLGAFIANTKAAVMSILKP